MTYRILHLADLHLDRTFALMGCNGELARRRRQGLRDALRRVGDVARESSCSAVTIGGDLYEHERAGTETGRFLTEMFASWAPLPVFIAPGNHDPWMPGGLYQRVDWPANVTVFTEPSLQPVALEDGLTLWGLGHQEPAWQGNPLDIDRVGGDGGAHLALFHGAELGSRPEGKSVHGPFRIEQIRERGFALALCGHYHRQRLDSAAGLLYPGTPEPLAFDEDGDRGPVLVEINSNTDIALTPLALNAWKAGCVEVDVTGATSASAVAELATAEGAAASHDRVAERILIRIDLVGRVAPDVSLDLASLEQEVSDRLGIAALVMTDQTRPDVDAFRIAGEPSTRGAFARALLEQMGRTSDPGETAFLNESLRYGLEALSGVDVGLR